MRDDEYDFGQSKFDLILFSWTKPLVPFSGWLMRLSLAGSL